MPRPGLAGSLMAAIRMCRSLAIGGVVEIGIEVRLTSIGFVRVRNTIPTQPRFKVKRLVARQLSWTYSRIGIGVPVTAVLNRVLAVAIGKTEQEVRKVITGDRNH